MNSINYKDLIVWQKAVMLAKEIYIVTSLLPKNEIYGLSAQMQRAAVSIASNIAEGQGRNHKKEFVNFLAIAYGSSAELETQILIAKDKYPKPDYDKSESLLLEIQKMLKVLMKRLSIN